MTGSISRKLFQHLLFLYPKLFRNEFGKEMLDVFDECKHSQSSWRLLADVLLSAVKQQIHDRSIRVSKNATPYSEIGMSLNLARLIAGAALGALLIAGVLAPAKRDGPQHATMVYPEALFWFPIIPEARSCSEIPGHPSEPERIFTTGALVIGDGESRRYWAVVRGKSGLWISNVSWGWYCLDPSSGYAQQPN